MGSGWVRLIKLGCPSAKLRVKIIFGWVGLRAKRTPPPPLVNKACPVNLEVPIGILTQPLWQALTRLSPAFWGPPHPFEGQLQPPLG